MIVKYLIDESKEFLTDRNSLRIEFNLSKTKLHHMMKELTPSKTYRGFFLYNYDEVKQYLKNNQGMSEILD